jgi:hypothetical protein
VAWRKNSSFVLLDRQGRNAAEIMGTFLKYFVSADGDAIAVLEKAFNDKEKDDESVLLLRWFNRDGQQIGSYQFSRHDDDPLPQIAFDASGSHLLIVNPAAARLIFLNNNGQVLREAALFADADYINERPFFLTASAETFIVLSQFSPSTNARTAAPTVIYFSATGHEQWRRELRAGTAGNLTISQDGNWIAANRYLVNGGRIESTVEILNRNGELRNSLNGLFRRAVFAKDGSRLLLMDRRQLRASSIPKGDLLWKFNLRNRAEMFVDIAADAEQNKVFALIGASVFKENRFVFENARIIGFNNRGKQQIETPVKTALSSPMLAISHDGKQLSLAAEGLLQNFSISDSNK